MPTRKCVKCGETKATTEFVKHPECRDGITHWCKQCDGEYQHQYYLANKDEIRTRSREWYEQNKERALARQRRYREAHLEEHRAKNRAWAQDVKGRPKVIPEEKECRKCGEVKPAAEFNKDSHRTDGLYAYCKVCKSENDRAYREKNKEKISAKDKKYRAANKEKLKETKRKWLAKNMDKRRATALRYARRKRGGGEMVSEEEMKELFRMFGNACACCGSEDALEADHIIPLKKGGRNIIGNLQILCRSCNAKKHVETRDFRSLEMTAKYSKEAS